MSWVGLLVGTKFCWHLLCHIGWTCKLSCVCQKSCLHPFTASGSVKGRTWVGAKHLTLTETFTLLDSGDLNLLLFFLYFISNINTSICYSVLLRIKYVREKKLLVPCNQDAAAAAAKSLQSYPTLCDPMDCSLPGSSIHGIFQARVLEWVAIAFSV